MKFSFLSFSIGAAIYVELQQFPMLYSSIVSNPLCFIQYEESTLPPIQWQPVSTYVCCIVLILKSVHNHDDLEVMTLYVL